MTIKDIAQRSGYAVGTVSRVLNGHPDVSETARKRILAVVAETGFRPNDNARHLKQRQSREVAIIVKGAGNLLFADILEEVQSHIRAQACATAVYYLDEDDDEVLQAAQVSRERKPLGIMFLGGNRGNFSARFHEVSAPSVLVTTRADTLGLSGLSSVSTDDVEGSARAMGLLLDSGHRRVGILGGQSCFPSPAVECNTSQLRIIGSLQAFSQRGIPFDPQRRTVASRYSLQGGYEAACTLLDRCPDTTAIFAMADVMALGALRAIHDRGLRVPEDISLIGYDGILQATFCVPRLATIRQNVPQLARRGVDILLRQAGGGGASHEIVPFELVRGESVRNICV